ncbi:hypothetical protein F5B22DRAFT_654927 [Xylaria bambusicola]|uniref:uncharacterized protein n=1 Tax=Xylaria bambusicola TaxID=326684 RepID=UPI002008E76A|nr:uncharacterized protein F5B22DRAFT_654927 [Xylaria bambusicola]KAI0517283.1 hypothetical protein F5B22DRAFT_654927 [Xylaria bambusicola]
MSSSRRIPANRPLYTRAILNNIEAELATDGENIELINGLGDKIRTKNLNRGNAIGTRGLSPWAQRAGSIVGFQDSRDLQRLEAIGKVHKFFPVYNAVRIFNGPNQTAKETRKAFGDVLEAFEGSQEATAIADLVKTQLNGRHIDKVIAFGLGPIGIVRPHIPRYSLYEHAAVIILTNALIEVSSSKHVFLAVQDPGYTTVCKQVLGEFGFGIVEGFGAKGFALIDDSTVVITHHPSFPFKQIIADIARPAMLCMKSTAALDKSRRTTSNKGLPDIRADVDSERTRAMMQEYRSVDLPIPRQMAFYDNSWFIRNEHMPLSEVNGSSRVEDVEE